MGEYIKHPNALEEEEIKIAVYREQAETWFAKHILQEFLHLGYGDFNGNKFTGSTKTLEDLIERYDEINTSFIAYKNLVKVDPYDVKYYDPVKKFILDENIGFVLWDGDEKVLVIADHQEGKFREYAKEQGWEQYKQYTIRPYHFDSMDYTEVLAVSKRDDDYEVRYKQMKYGSVGTYYAKSNELIEHGSLGTRVWKVGGEYGGEFVANLIERLDHVSIDPKVNKEELVEYLKQKREQVLAIEVKE